MDVTSTITRRAGLKAALLLGMIANTGVVARATNAQQASATSEVLVAYLTRTGNTRLSRARSAGR